MNKTCKENGAVNPDGVAEKVIEEIPKLLPDAFFQLLSIITQHNKYHRRNNYKS